MVYSKHLSMILRVGNFKLHAKREQSLLKICIVGQE